MGTTQSGSISVQLLKHRAYEEIKQKIINFALRPNEQLIEQRLAEELGISKSPIREALQRLEKDGLVYTLPFKGCFVTEITEKDVRQTFQLREALETFCMKMGCDKFSTAEIQEFRKILVKGEKALKDGDLRESYIIDRQIHGSLISFSKNPKIIQAYEDIINTLYRYWNVSTLISGRVAKSHEQHISMVEALEKRDKILAEMSVSNHLESVLEDFIKSNEFRIFCRLG